MTQPTTTQQPQQSTALGLIVARLKAERRHDRERCWGISSDALAIYGVLTDEPEPGRSQYPADFDDLAACERTYSMAPASVRARMLPVLEKYRAHVEARRG